MESENSNQSNISRAEQWKLDPPKPPRTEDMGERETKIDRINRHRKASELGRRVPTYLAMARKLSGNPDYNEIPASLIPTPPNYNGDQPQRKSPTVAEILSDNPDVDAETKANLRKGVGKMTVSAILDLRSDVTQTTDQTPEGQFQLPTMDSVALPPRPDATTQAMKDVPLPPRPEK